MRILAVSDWSLARRILLLQAVILVVVLGSALAALLYDTDAETERQTGERVTAIATTVAAAPTVRTSATDIYPAGAEITAPSELLQPYAERVRQQTNADFVVVMRPDGVRYTHPDPNEIGQVYRGSRDVALAGGVGLETYTGTLGPSIRAIAPVTDDGGDVVALVAVGVTVEHLDAATNRRLLVLGAIAAGALLVGIGRRHADLEVGSAPDPRHGHTRAGADVHVLRRSARLRARGDAAAGRRRADRQRERGGQATPRRRRPRPRRGGGRRRPAAARRAADRRSGGPDRRTRPDE